MLMHPALDQLSRYQRGAVFRRLRRGFSCKRRFYLSILGALLGVVWLGNVTLSVMFREPAAPERFRLFVAAGFLVYGLWHVVKVAFQRPPQPIEWTPAEEELLCGGPFERRELIVYRLCTIFNASLVKATCFTVLMLPDLTRPMAGFIGTLAALCALDLIRITLEIIAFSLSRSVYRRFQIAMGAIVTASVSGTLLYAYAAADLERMSESANPLALVFHVGRSASYLLETLPGRTLLRPFQIYTDIIATTRYDLSWQLNLFAGTSLAMALLWGVFWADRYFSGAVLRREQTAYPPLAGATTDANGSTRTLGTRTSSTQGANPIRWFGGAGPIAWRQLLGARRCSGQLMMAMAFPGVLALTPLAVARSGPAGLLHVAGALTFYSFMLLPTALKFDFRRDIMRMGVLKTLPISPLSLVVGQIATPTLLSLAFQCTVLAIACLIRPFPLWMGIATVCLLAPLNALIFSVDNLVFMLYPYRLNQEGFEIFLRTTLTFTAKGLIFTLGLLVTLAWSYAANYTSRRLLGGLADPALVFVTGGAFLLLFSTWFVISLLSKAYIRFDPSQDLPA
ncbi:MAG: hypothetical protein KDB23_08200 [Planctomycetales bacterium]|nr:hypothetical protein [Planctomycetales bacterium]